MTPQEQEKLFEKVRRRYKNWDFRQASGYVHGVVDGLRLNEPQPYYIRGFDELEPYAICYIYGFIDAYGEDAFDAAWNQEFRISKTVLCYRWWENVE